MKHKEQVIKGILSDFILWNRIANQMFEAINAFNPEEKEDAWIPEHHYKGYYNIFKLLEIQENDDLVDKLSGLTMGIAFDNKEMHLEELTEKIYQEWMVCIREKCITLLPVK